MSHVLHVLSVSYYFYGIYLIFRYKVPAQRRSNFQLEMPSTSQSVPLLPLSEIDLGPTVEESNN
jgi:hypothetical protein